MDRVKVVFFCGERSPWGYAHLEPLLKHSAFEVAAVVLATEQRWNHFRRALSGEEPPSRYRRLRPKQLLARLLGRAPMSNTQKVRNLLSGREIPVLWCDDANASEALNRFQRVDAELLFSAAYPQIFRPPTLSLFPGGAFNSHPSLLPRCRGAHPVFWALASGETRSGSTIHIMTPEIDQGDIVAQIEIEIEPCETRSQLYGKLINTVPDLLDKFADFLFIPGSKPIPQEQSEATYFRNDRRIHRRIFWSEMTAPQIHNLVRACDGQAYFWHQGRRVRVERVEFVEKNRNMTNDLSVPAGTVVDLDANKPIIAARSGFVKLLSVKGSRWRGLPFDIGQVLS